MVKKCYTLNVIILQISVIANKKYNKGEKNNGI